jgi:hypothetical protein
MSDQQDFPEVDEGHEIPDAEDAFVNDLARQVTEQVQGNLAQGDPWHAQQQREAAEYEAQVSRGAYDVVQAHPWVGADAAAANHLVGEARRAALALGDSQLGDDPTFWGQVARAIEGGAQGDAIPAAIAQNMAKDSIVNAPHRGAGALPFGGGFTVNHQKES